MMTRFEWNGNTSDKTGVAFLSYEDAEGVRRFAEIHLDSFSDLMAINDWAEAMARDHTWRVRHELIKLANGLDDNI